MAAPFGTNRNRGMRTGVFLWLAVCALFCVACTVGFAAEPALPVEPPLSQNEAQTGTQPAAVGVVGEPGTDIPSPNPAPLPRTAVGAPTHLPGTREGFIDFRADELRTAYSNGEPALTTARGNVTAQLENMSVTAQRAEVDHTTNQARFDGSVVFRVGEQEVRGDQITLDIETGEWSFLGATSIITPKFVQGYLVEPLYASGPTIQGTRDRSVAVSHAQVTSCSLKEPHYNIVARSMTVYPGSKIVFRDAAAYGLGRKLFTLKRLVVPIREIQRNPALIPRVGRTVEEGYFLKTAYTYLGSKSQTGQLLLDLMSEKGVGLGLQHDYTYANARGNVYLYRIEDQNINRQTMLGRIKHSQTFGTIDTSFSTDFRSYSYLYAPESKSLMSRLTLTRNRPDARSSLTINRSAYDTSVSTTSLTGSLRHTQQFGDDTSVGAKFDYSGFTTNSLTRARLASEVEYERQGEKFDWALSAYKLTDLSDEAYAGTGVFAGIERLPELALMTDTTRLGKLLPLGIPANFRFSYGKYVEQPADLELDRTYFEIQTPRRQKELSNTWSVTGATGFRQYLYSDNTAQYSVDANAALSKTLGSRSSFSLTYRYQQPEGYTPFRFDYVGRYNAINARLNVEESEKLKFSVLTGFNFERTDYPWSDITLRASYQPTKSLLLYTATGYDLNRSRWETVINQLRIRAGSRFSLDLGTRYDTTRSKFSTIKAQLDTQLGDKMRLQAVAGYNGLTEEFEYRSFMLTRDLHCWEASLVYVDQGGFYENEGLSINFRIKAFPVFQNFGMGPFGQTLDTSVGQIY